MTTIEELQKQIDELKKEKERLEGEVERLNVVITENSNFATAYINNIVKEKDALLVQCGEALEDRCVDPIYHYETNTHTSCGKCFNCKILTKLKESGVIGQQD